MVKFRNANGEEEHIEVIPDDYVPPKPAGPNEALAIGSWPWERQEQLDRLKQEYTMKIKGIKDKKKLEKIAREFRPLLDELEKEKAKDKAAAIAAAKAAVPAATTLAAAPPSTGSKNRANAVSNAGRC